MERTESRLRMRKQLMGFRGRKEEAGDENLFKLLE